MFETNMTFEDVQKRVEQGKYTVCKAFENNNGYYVELWGDESTGDGLGVKVLEYYMESKQDLDQVKEQYM